MTKNKEKVLLKGVIPSVGGIIHKSAKKGQKSFRITSELLDKLITSTENISKRGLLVISIPANSKENYILTCQVHKEKI